MSKKLTLNFSYSFSGQIWRILADVDTAILVVEIREGVRRKADFAAIHHNKLLYTSVSLPENWWISAVAIHKGILVLHTYPDSQTPVPKGILAFDVIQAKLFWQQSQLSYIGFDAATSSIIAIEALESGLIYRLVDLRTGKISDILPSQEQLMAEVSTPSTIIFPQHYTQENKYFQPIVTFLYKVLGIQAEKAVDYAEYQHLLIISYYLYAHNTLSNFLAVIDRQANVLLHESIATQLSGTGLDTFCIMKNHLIFVREKKELLSYEL